MVAINKRNAKEGCTLWSFQPQFMKKETCTGSMLNATGRAGGTPGGYQEVIERKSPKSEKPHRNARRRDSEKKGRGPRLPETSRNMRNKMVGKVTRQLVALKEGQTPLTHNEGNIFWAEAGVMEKSTRQCRSSGSSSSFKLQDAGCFWEIGNGKGLDG